MRRGGRQWLIMMPRFHCPHCARELTGLAFAGWWRLPRKKRRKGRGEETREEGSALPSEAVDRRGYISEEED